MASSKRWGRGFQMDAKIVGAEALLKRLNAMGAGAEAMLAQATEDGMNAVVDDIKRDAPGDGIMVQRDEDNRGNATVLAGPDKAHWYYQFFETGVQPFEINLGKGRSKRSALNNTKSAAKGKAVRMTGRKIQGEAQALHWGDVFAKTIHRGGMSAKPFMRPNFIPQKDKIEQAFIDTIESGVIRPNTEDG